MVIIRVLKLCFFEAMPTALNTDWIEPYTPEIEYPLNLKVIYCMLSAVVVKSITEYKVFFYIFTHSED